MQILRRKGSLGSYQSEYQERRICHHLRPFGMWQNNTASAVAWLSSSWPQSVPLWSTLSLKKSSVTIIPSVTGNGKKGNRSNKKPALFRSGNTDGYTLEQFFYTICFQEYIRFFHQCITRHICRVLYEYRNGS